MRMWKQLGLAVLFAGAGVVPVAHAAEPIGPAFGTNKVVTAIEDVGGEADVDDYVAPLVVGEKLTVSVAASKKGALLPTLQILDPDGQDRTPELKVKKAGKKLSFKNLPIDKSGSWTVRISASTEGRGPYVAAFKVAKAKPTVLKKQTLDAATATEAIHTFPGIDGAQATITVKYAKKGSPVSIVALQDPSGGNVPSISGTAANDFTLKKTTLSLKKAQIARGDGPYALTVGIENGSATYDVKAVVKPLARPKKKVKIPAIEPFLDVRGQPIRGVADAAITITGQNFGTEEDDQPTVLFDGVAGVVTAVAPDGRSLNVLPPDGTDGATVDVAVVDAFGQASQRADYFVYVPRPTITAIVDDAGAPVTAGSSTGGHQFRLLGTNFESGFTLRFDTRTAPGPAFVSETELRVTSPAVASATRSFLILTDTFGRTVTSPFQYEFKAPPQLSTIASSAYEPLAGREAGGTVVTILGNGFEAADEVLFDGEVIASTFISTTRLRFTSPAGDPGPYALALRDRVGAVVDGPDFRIKAAPRIDTISAIGGLVLPVDLLGLGGGTLLRVTGENLESDDTVTLGGAEVTPTFRSSTEIQFPAPETTPGTVDVVVTDVLGDETTLTDVFTSIGFDDVTSTRLPAGTAVDDFGAVAGAFGSLDGDARADDLVIVGLTGGTRTEEARFFQGDGDGNLVDVTASKMPAASADPLGIGFGGTALAIGDLDNANGPEIVVGDQTYFNGTSGYYYDGIRVMVNDGSGNFTFSSSITPTANYYYYGGYIYANDELGSSQYIGVIIAPQPTSSIAAIAIGDLDGDGDREVVTTGASGIPMYFYTDPNVVDFRVDGYYVTSYDASNTTAYAYYYLSGTRILDNDSGLKDRTLQRFGVRGNTSSTNAANVGRDLALGDIDGENGLDIVITWDEPSTVSIYGNYSAYFNGTSSDSDRVATRVLLNDGTGFFEDETANWLPAASAPEFWQGHALELVDIVGDSKLDLVLVHDKGPTTFSSALRILRNDGAPTGFTDVTSTVLPTLPNGELLTGSSVRVVDVNDDGHDDIIVATSRGVVDNQGGTARSTRILFGNAGGTFSFGPEFIESASTDSGETEFLAIGDLAGHDDPVLILGAQDAPQNSSEGEKLRAFDWED